MHKIYLSLLIIGTSLNCADDIGREFIQLKREENEASQDYFERISPLLPTWREFMLGRLNGEYIIYKKGDKSIEILINDISNAEKYLPTLFDSLLQKRAKDL